MNRPWLLNLGLLLLVAVLAVLAVWTNDSDQQAPLPVSTLDRNRVHAIYVQQPTEPEIKLRKNDSGWRLIAPFQAPASEHVVDSLFAISRVGSTKRFPLDAGTDKDKYGFDSPRLRIRYDDEEIVIGDTSPLNQQHYLLYRNQVHLVSGNVLWSIPRAPTQYIDPRLLDGPETPSSIEFGGVSKLHRDNGSWKLTPPLPSLGSDALTRIANEWQYARALKVSMADRAQASETVRIHYPGDKVVEIGVVRRQPELVLLHPARGLLYHFSRGTAERLFPPNRFSKK
jgi:hypothetical protein